MKAKIFITLLMMISINCWAQKPNQNNFRYALQTLKDEKFIQNENLNRLNDNLVFLPWKQIDGSFGLLPVIVLENEYNIKEDVSVKYDEIYNMLEKRLKLLREIYEYHQAIKQAELDLQKLKQERVQIAKRLELLKTILTKKNSTQLNRLE